MTHPHDGLTGARWVYVCVCFACIRSGVNPSHSRIVTHVSVHSTRDALNLLNYQKEVLSYLFKRPRFEFQSLNPLSLERILRLPKINQTLTRIITMSSVKPGCLYANLPLLKDEASSQLLVIILHRVWRGT